MDPIDAHSNNNNNNKVLKGNNHHEHEIDDSLYSRQRYVLGDVAMLKLKKSHVFLSGLGGLGVEVAKNLILAGPGSVTLHDTQKAHPLDLSTQFYINVDQIGKNRATASETKLSELNPYVKIHTSNEPLEQLPLDYFSQFTCVVFTDTVNHDLILKISDYCHEKDIKFIISEARGVFSYTFVDFGNSFEVHDKNGEEPLETLIQEITNANKAVVTTLNHHLHGFETGDFVQFKEVVGMEDLNETVHQVNVLTPNSFEILTDTTKYNQYIRGGSAFQVKVPHKIKFESLRNSLQKPEFLISDFVKFERPGQLHIAFQALQRFTNEAGFLPRPWSNEDANKLVAITKHINDIGAFKVDQIDENLVKNLAYTAQGSFSPLTAFLGGFVAQEIIKGVTGKFTPLLQWLYFDCDEVLPKNHLTGKELDASSLHSKRSEGQVIVLGSTLCEKLENFRVFTVGSGAIGCEMLKNYALLGVGSGSSGLLTITDNDLIEKSNLNRQFLFRSSDIQSPKSTTAAKAAGNMNPALNIISHIHKVEPATEEIYSDNFYQNVDVVVNALDNVAARLYVDSRIVTNQKALLESGTLGAKGHVQVVIPHLTESYGSQRDPPEKETPYCTLKSFPNNLDHTIQWARDKFQNLFVNKPTEVNQLLAEDDFINYLKTRPGGPRVGPLKYISKLLDTAPRSFEDCIAFARKKFESYYVNSIKQLLITYPVDLALKDGTPFWASPKRPPKFLTFNPDDEAHLNFVYHTASLWARVFGVPVPLVDLSWVSKKSSEVVLPVFQFRHGKKIIVDENAAAPTEEFDPNEFDKLAEQVRAKFIAKGLKSGSGLGVGGLPLQIDEFEKDVDENHHIDFITAVANLRARNYSIAEGDRLKIKRIAGKIIPAMATSTSAVSGLVAIELVKLAKRSLVNGEKDVPLTLFKNCFINLGLPLFAFSEPGEVHKTRVTKSSFTTLWDKWEIKKGREITLAEFNKYFLEKFKLEVNGVFQDVTMIYTSIFPNHAKRLTQNVGSLVKRNESDKYVDLIVSFIDEDGNDADGPPVRYWFGKN